MAAQIALRRKHELEEEEADKQTNGGVVTQKAQETSGLGGKGASQNNQDMEEDSDDELHIDDSENDNDSNDNDDSGDGSDLDSVKSNSSGKFKHENKLLFIGFLY